MFRSSQNVFYSALEFCDKENRQCINSERDDDEGALISLQPFNAKCLNFAVLEHSSGAYYTRDTFFHGTKSFHLAH